MKKQLKLTNSQLALIITITLFVGFLLGAVLSYKSLAIEREQMFNMLNHNSQKAFNYLEEQIFCADKYNFSLMECKYEKYIFDAYNYGEGNKI